MKISQIFLVAIFVSSSFAAPVDPNVALVEKFHSVLIETMKQGTELGIQGRYKKLEPVIESAFDLTSMTKFTVGPKWSGMNADEQKLLIAAFKRMTIANYARNFNSFKGQKFVVDPAVEVRAADRLVKSQVLPANEKPVNLTYRIRDFAGSPKIIDVIYEFVSQLATRRSDFAATVNEGGAAALVTKLNQVSDELMKEK